MKAMNLNEAIYQDSLSLPRTNLSEYSSRNYSAVPQDVWDKLSERKKFAVSANDPTNRDSSMVFREKSAGLKTAL